jgi:hypothetical protein
MRDSRASSRSGLGGSADRTRRSRAPCIAGSRASRSS